MTRKNTLRWTLLLITVLGCSGDRLQASDDRPNIIFIMVDDLGPVDLGCYGSKTIMTPRIDRMAAEGMKFTNAYSPSSCCAPCRASLLTGMHQGHANMRSNTGGTWLQDSDVTFGEVIGPAGYEIGGFGKWGVGDVRTPGVPEQQGFDDFFGYYHQIHAHTYFTDFLWRNGQKVELPENRKFTGKENGPIPVKANGLTFTHYLIKDEMFKWIRKHKDEPFLCYAPWTPPHAKYAIPETDPAWQMYKDKPWPMQDRVHAAFATMIDRQVGELIDLLKELGLDEKTMVMFCSDNGASMPFKKSHNSSGPYRGKKLQVYEGGIRAPLIARWPGKIQPGTVSDHKLSWIDMMPTFADICGAANKVPEIIDGISFAPTLLGNPKEQQQHEYLYFEWIGYNWNNSPLDPEKLAQAIRIDDWKLVRHGVSNPWELYDLSNDIGETTDLADKNPAIVKRLKAKIAEVRTDPIQQIEPEMPKGRKYRD